MTTLKAEADRIIQELSIIWVTDRHEATGFDLVSHLNRDLDSDQRHTILRIKRTYHECGLLRDGLSTRIYEAVAGDGVRTVDQFREWLKRNA